MATAEQTKAAIDNYLKAWQTNDRELLLQTFADDAIWEDPVGSPAFVGREAIAGFWDFGHQSGNTLTPVFTQCIICGTEGILRFTMQLRTPDGKKGLDLAVVDRFVVNDRGEIQHAQAYWDASCASQPEGLEFFVPNVQEMHTK